MILLIFLILKKQTRSSTKHSFVKSSPQLDTATTEINADLLMGHVNSSGCLQANILGRKDALNTGITALALTESDASSGTVM